MYPKKIILASASPRRQQLLAQLGVPFDVMVADIDESQLAAEDPESYVKRLAQAKAQVVAQRRGDALPVLGADTIVVAAGQILGKPSDKADFIRMMQLLSGACHYAMTAVALVTAAESRVVLVKTEVCFRPLADCEIELYWQSGEPQDKAGGYGIQGIAAKFIKHISGSYGAVVGLPLCETDQLLRLGNEC